MVAVGNLKVVILICVILSTVLYLENGTNQAPTPKAHANALELTNNRQVKPTIQPTKETEI